MAESSTPRSVPVRLRTQNREQPRMSSFDPALVRRAVAEFTPRRPQRFQELAAAREVILELRQKRASYRAIAELLTQHCLPTSKTAIAAFCHEILGEIIRPKRRPNRKRPPLPPPQNGGADDTSTVPMQIVQQTGRGGSVSDASEAKSPATQTRGPRIAQVRMLNKKQ